MPRSPDQKYGPGSNSLDRTNLLEALREIRLLLHVLLRAAQELIEPEEAIADTLHLLHRRVVDQLEQILYLRLERPEHVIVVLKQSQS